MSSGVISVNSLGETTDVFRSFFLKKKSFSDIITINDVIPERLYYITLSTIKTSYVPRVQNV